MKKEIVLVLILLISFPVMADELGELGDLESFQKAIDTLLSSSENCTFQEQALSERPVRSRPFRDGPLKDYQRDKPQYQFVSVLKSTITEVPEGSIFKSNNHGIRFFFNDHWLVLSNVKEYFPNEFGEIMQRYSYQWTLKNFIDGNPNYKTSIRTDGGSVTYVTHKDTPAVMIDCISERNPVNEPMVYPLRLTNDLHVIEFSAPQELAAPQKEN